MLIKTAITKNLKKFGLLLGCFLMFASSAEANRGYYRRANTFKPTFALSASAGLTMYEGLYEDNIGVYEDVSLAHGIVGIAGHLWVHPNLSLDLGLDYQFITDFDTNRSFSYVSLKPGIRVRHRRIYVRGALDVGVAQGQDPIVFGFLIGVGARVPISHQLRFFGEIDFQVIAAAGYVLPFNAKLGVEMMF